MSCPARTSAVIACQCQEEKSLLLYCAACADYMHSRTAPARGTPYDLFPIWEGLGSRGSLTERRRLTEIAADTAHWRRIASAKPPPHSAMVEFLSSFGATEASVASALHWKSTAERGAPKTTRRRTRGPHCYVHQERCCSRLLH